MDDVIENSSMEVLMLLSPMPAQSPSPGSSRERLKSRAAAPSGRPRCRAFVNGHDGDLAGGHLCSESAARKAVDDDVHLGLVGGHRHAADDARVYPEPAQSLLSWLEARPALVKSRTSTL